MVGIIVAIVIIRLISKKCGCNGEGGSGGGGGFGGGEAVLAVVEVVEMGEVVIEKYLMEIKMFKKFINTSIYIFLILLKYFNLL